MPTSPDLSAYNPLVFYDVLPQDLVARAVPARATYTPDYSPVEGDVDLEQQGTLAAMVCEEVYALNRIPDGLFYLLSNIEGVPRLEGLPAQVTLRFTVTPSSVGVDIPAGFIALADLGTGQTVTFVTSASVVSAPDATTVDALAVATEVGTFANGVPANTVLDPQTAVTQVEQVKVQAVSAGGVDPEDDQAFLSRYATRRQRATEAIATPLQAQYYAAEVGAALGVFRALGVQKWDGASGTPGDDEGHLTVAVRGTAGAAVSGPVKTQLEADMNGRAMPQIHVVDATITDVDVTTQVVRLPGYDGATVTANIRAALTAYLSTDTWLWGSTVYRNELIQTISNAAGVDRVVTITTPATDVALTGPAPLVRLDDLTVSFA